MSKSAHNYCALFLEEASREKLLRLHPPKHEVVYADHLTLVFGRHRLEEIDKAHNLSGRVGDELAISVIASADDENGQAVECHGFFFGHHEQWPHITISCKPGIPPRYSNCFRGQTTRFKEFILVGTVGFK